MSFILGKNMLIRILAEVMIGLRGLLILPFLPKALGTIGYGVFSQIWITVSLAVPTLSLSLDNAIVRSVSSEISPNAHSKSLWTSLFASSLFSILIVIVSINFASEWIGYAIFGPGDWKHEMLLLSILILLGIPLTIGQSYFQGCREFIFVSIFQLTRSVGITTLMILTALQGSGIQGIIQSAIFGEAFALFILFLVICRRLGRPVLSWPTLPNMILFGVPLAASNLLFILLNAIPRYVLVQESGLEAVAIYAASLSLLSPIGQLVSPMQYVLFPETSTLWQNGQSKKAIAYIYSATFAFIALTIPLVVVLTAMGKPLLQILTRRALVAIPILFFFLGLGNIFLGSFRLASLRFLVINKTGHIFVSLLLSVLACLITSIVLVPLIGTAGAGLGFLGGNLTLVIVACIYLWSKELPAVLTRNWVFLVRCLGAGGFAYFLATALRSPGPAAVVLAALSSVLSYFLFLLALGGLKDLVKMVRFLILGDQEDVPDFL